MKGPSEGERTGTGGGARGPAAAVPADGAQTNDPLAGAGAFPKPVIRRRWWPFPIVWGIPLLAIVVAGYYFSEHQRDRGPDIVLAFSDASGVKAGDTTVNYRGADVGQVTAVELSGDQRRVRVKVRLRGSATAFAKEGAQFWIVRPEISAGTISGLGTIVSGPYIEAVPGTGRAASEFDGLQKAPTWTGDGLEIILHADRLERIQPDAPVYYRGIQVGTIRDAKLGANATHVDITLTIWGPYRQLVRANSMFWTVKGADIQGGVFSGVKVSLGSLRTLLQGGISFASPDDPVGKPVEDGKDFTLYDEPKKEWLTWAPRLPVGRVGAGEAEGGGAGDAGGGAGQ
jgi:paraquat-inducible protein B